MTLSSPHRERPLARRSGLPPSALSTAELLVRVMGLRRPHGLEVARELLLGADGSLEALARGEGLGRQGVGPAARRRLEAALELGTRARGECLPPPTRVRGPEDVACLMGPRLQGLPHEEFHVILLNTRHRVLATRIVSRGILDASLVHPREVFAPALEARASAIVLVHNHPSGDPTPSPEDHRVTRQMAAAGDLLGVRVLDHLIIGNPEWRSIPPDGGG